MQVFQPASVPDENHRLAVSEQGLEVATLSYNPAGQIQMTLLIQEDIISCYSCSDVTYAHYIFSILQSKLLLPLETCLAGF